MNTKPLLLLDIDGVLCPFHWQTLPEGCRQIDVVINGTTCQGRYIDTLTVAFDERQLARLERLAEAFELVWATIWEEFANTKLAPLTGLPLLPVILIDASIPSPVPVRFSELMAGNTTEKLGPVAAYVGERPFAWVDDQLRYDATDWAKERDATGLPTLLVRTDPRVGLTDAEVAQLLAFASSLTQPVA
jgi:hypothetical protein